MRHTLLASGIALLLAFAVGCDNGAPPDTTGGGDDDGTLAYTGPIVGRVKGVVTLPDGSGIEGVQVALVGTELSATTSVTGYYEIDEVTPDELTLQFTKRGYTGNTKETEVTGWETRTVNARLLEVDGMGLVGVAAGGRVETSELKVDFPANAFVDMSGSPVSGDVQVSVTHIDPTTDEILAAPNQFTALAGDDGDITVGLASYAMVDVQMTMDGDEVQLADGVNAELEMVIPDDLPEMQQIGLGDTVPYWHFDEDLATWVYEGETTVIPSTTDPGRMAAKIDAPYFSAWNLDDCWWEQDLDGNNVQVCANMPITCVAGNVDDVGNNQVIGADVYAAANNFQGTISGTSDEDGTYILWPIMEGAVIDISVDVVVGQSNYHAQDGSYTVASPDGSSLTSPPTDPSQCMQVPVIEIPTCVVGAVVEVDNRRMWEGVNVIEDATTGKAYFFEPDGTPETCSNIEPVDMPEDTCEIMPTEDDVLDFFWGQEPLDAGHEVQVVTGNDTFQMEQVERIPDDHFYEASTIEQPLPFDTRMDVYAYGQQGDIPEVDLPAALPMGRELRTTDPPMDQWFTLTRDQGLPIRTETYDSEAWGNIAMIIPEDTSQGICMCRFKDDGSFDIPAEVTGLLPKGPAAILISRIKADIEQLPNGYWARTLGRSSTTMIGEID